MSPAEMLDTDTLDTAAHNIWVRALDTGLVFSALVFFDVQAPPPDIVGPLPSAPNVSSWAIRANPGAGVRELEWFEANRHRLTNHAGLWIAILGTRIEASGESFDEVASTSPPDALIVRVPEDTRWDHLIA